MAVMAFHKCHTGIMKPRTLKPPEDRFWAGVKKTDTCWLWMGTRSSSGYGKFYSGGHNRSGKYVSTHRWAYEYLVGPIPAGREIDHLCRVRACCNPAHLEAVDHRTNILRGHTVTGANAARTHCVNGHEFTAQNTYHPPSRPTRRICKKCAAIRAKRAYERSKSWQ